ncbi:MAG: hypothetical protein QXX94_07375 [Candidatus Bathyarchaeia archaeon]
MAGAQIRLRYSGLILFLFKLFSVGTGLVFTLIITRNVTPAEYGVYGNLSDILSYFTLTSSIIPFWVTRFTARQRQGAAETGLILNIIVAFISATIYLVTLSWIMDSLRISREYLPTYIVGSLIIIGNHIVAVLEATLYSKHPETLGFGLFIFEVSRVIIGFLLLIILKLGLIGAIIGLSAASFIQSIFYLLKYLLREFEWRIRWDYAKEWFKASILNVYSIISGRMLTLANLFLFIYAGNLSRAYYGAALSIALIIGYSSSLAFALYPKLLLKSDTGHEDVALSMKMVLMFAVPMTLGAIVLSEDILSLLSVSYAQAKPVLITLSIDSLLSSFSSIFGSIVGGTEKFDADVKIRYRDIVRSRLFLLLTLNYVQAAMVTLPIYIILASARLSALEAAIYLALINMVVNAILTLARYIIARRCLEFNMPWLNIAKYFGASLAMSLILYVFQTPARLTIVVPKILFGGFMYFLILLIIDRETRETLKSAIKRGYEKHF